MAIVIKEKPEGGPNDYNPPRGNKGAKNKDLKITVAAAGSVIPICYGRVRLAPMVSALVVSGDTLVLRLIWALGEWDSIEALKLNDEDSPGAVTVTHYMGTASQTADSTLVNLISGYTDTLVATINNKTWAAAYSVVQVPKSASDGFPNFEIIAKARKCFDPRDSLTKFTDNPSLILRDFLVNFMGRSVPDADVIAAADSNDEVMSDGKKRRTLNISYLRITSVESIADELAAYAGVILAPEGNTTRMILDRPVAVSRTITTADFLQNTINIRRLPMRDRPTVVKVTYTDASNAKSWEDKTESVQRDGVASGTLERRIQELSRPGIHNAQQAHREAVEVLNRYWLSDVKIDFVTRDKALQDQIGDVHNITHALGVSADMRLVSMEPESIGRWRVAYEKYDQLIYSDEVIADPGSSIVSLPDPLDIPIPSGLVLSEIVKQRKDGTFYSVIRAQWNAVTYPFQFRYHVRVSNASRVAASFDTTNIDVETPIVEDLVNYTVEVLVVSAGGLQGDAASAMITIDGKFALPGDVPSIQATRLSASIVRLTWQAATDLDIWRYRIRQGASWDAGTLIASPDQLTHDVTDLALGSYSWHIKAEDSVRQLSVNAASVSLTLTAPGDVPSITGLEIGGEVRLSWTKASGFVARYEIRWGATGGTWATAAFLDAVDTLSTISKDFPSGTWRFYVKSIDDAGNYSTNATSTDIEVTNDAAAFLTESYSFTSPTLTNMTGLAGTGGSTIYLTDMGETWNSLFPNNMDTYTNVLATYHASGTSEWLSETFDFGSVTNSTWRLSHTAVALSGTITSYLELSTDAVTWQQYAAATVKTEARYARARFTATGTSTLKVTTPGVTLRIDITTKTETADATETSLASGAKTIYLKKQFVGAKNITVTPINTSARSYAIDNIIVGGPYNSVEPKESVLQMVSTYTSGANAQRWVYTTFLSGGTYVVQSDDVLKYEIFGDIGNTETSMGVDVETSDAIAFTGQGLNDQNGLGSFADIAAQANGTWYEREFTGFGGALNGKTLEYWMIFDEDNSTATNKCYVRNVRIESPLGAVRLTVYNGGDPSESTDRFSQDRAGSITKRFARASFDVYIFDGAAAQTATDFLWQFVGA